MTRIARIESCNPRKSAADLLVELRKLFAQICDFGQIINDDIGLVRVVRKVILVIILGLVKRFQRRHLRDDALLEHLCAVELVNVGLGHSLLFLVAIKNSGAILRPVVWPLAACFANGYPSTN